MIRIFVVEEEHGMMYDSDTEIDSVWRSKYKAFKRLRELKKDDKYRDVYIYQLKTED